MTQLQFGQSLGVSGRTAKRWERGSSHPGVTLKDIIAMMVPVDRDLAEEIANEAAPLFDALRQPRPQVPPATPEGAQVATPAPAVPHATVHDLADVVLCAVAEASDLPPRAVRPLLHVAFARAHALGLTVEQLEEAFKPRADAKTRVARSALRLRVQGPDRPESVEVEPSPAERRRARAR